MKKAIVILIFLAAAGNSFSQGYRLSLNTSHLYFYNFDEDAQLFHGFSGDYCFLLSSLGAYVGGSFYLPASYYGAKYFYNPGDYTDNVVRVNARGGAYSIGFGFTYDLLRAKNGRTRLSLVSGLAYFDHTGKFDKEPFVRIYGGADNINVSFFSYTAGACFSFKAGYLPLAVSLKSNIPLGKREYDSFHTSGFIELTLGVVFPVLKSPAPTDIIEITY
ncbi:MAG: hypothetical protein ABIJ16_11770 [Bacteroidota bacterium]